MVAWIALTLSLVSTGILVWDRFLRQSKFEVRADWILTADDPTLRLAIYNVGHRKDCVRETCAYESAGCRPGEDGLRTEAF